ncbi:hypothetical protein HA402_005753 [Bradysia odoriphaga]|nr:hypothetical protein HA402_005753 [Bradysia odoriphaga]
MKSKFLEIVTKKWLGDVKLRVLLSVFLIFIGALIIFYIKPQVVRIIVKYLFVAKPGRFVRNKLETKIGFKYKLYLWNVTNPNEIEAGIEKPKLQEIGPYIFHEYKQKVNSQDNATEDTVSYNFWSAYTFSPELSAPLTGEEKITLLNAVITSGVVKVHAERPHLLNLVVEAMDIIFKKPSSIFVTMKAIEFIDNGIEIDCNHTELSARAVCAEMRRSNLLSIMNDDKTLLRFRWFDSIKNDSIQVRYTVMRGSKNVRNVGRVIAINDRPLSVYKHDEKCNVINGTDTMTLPPFQYRDEILWIFSDAACKSFPLRFKYKTRVRGIKVTYKYLQFSDPLMSPTCECNEFTGCAVRGTLDLYQCLKLFLSASSPHYYLAEASIRDTVDGMNPDANLHETGCYLDLQLGVPLIARQRVQVNILLKRIPEYPIFSSIAGDIWFPLLWYEESFEIEKSDFSLIVVAKVLQNILLGIAYIIMTLGIGICAVTMAFILHRYVRDHVSVKPTEQTESSNQS